MKLLLAAFALALFMEGCSFALFPDFMRRQLSDLVGRSPAELRLFGICALVFAIILSILSSLCGNIL